MVSNSSSSRSQSEPDLSRRSVALGLGALLGFETLASCSPASAQSNNGSQIGTSESELSGTNFLWADTLTDLHAITGSTASSVLILKGIVKIGDGGGGVFFWDPASTADDNTGTVIAPTGVATGRWVRIINGPWSVMWFGATGDGSTQSDGTRIKSDTAFQKALAAIPQGQTLYIPAGTYYFNAAIAVNHSINIRGAGVGAGRGTELNFADGVNGLQLAGNVQSNITDIALYGGWQFGTGTVGDALIHGIVVRGPVSIERVWIQGFRGDGINVYGSAPAAIADTWRVSECTISMCGRHGLYAEGPDSNVGFVVSTNCVDNGNSPSQDGYGFYDNSVSGCTFVACNTNSNRGGAYCVVQATAISAIINCYTEGGQPASQLSGRTIVVGGTHESPMLGWKFQTDGMSPIMVNAEQGGQVTVGTPFLLGLQGATEQYPYHLEFQTAAPYANWYALKYAALDSSTALAFSGQQAAEGPGRAWVPNGIYVGAGSARVLVSTILDVNGHSANALPKRGREGDIMINEYPVIDGVALWQCVSPGNGTTTVATWRAVMLSGSPVAGVV